VDTCPYSSPPATSPNASTTSPRHYFSDVLRARVCVAVTRREYVCDFDNNNTYGVGKKIHRHRVSRECVCAFEQRVITRFFFLKKYKKTAVHAIPTSCEWRVQYNNTIIYLLHIYHYI